MPLFLNQTCKVCGTTPPADGARFCRNCGRAIHWTETAGGRRRAAGFAVAAAAVGLVVLAGLAMATVRHTAATSVTVVSAAGFRPAPALVRPANRAAAPPPPPLLGIVPRPAAAGTDLATDPLALYAGGPPADRLTVHGVGLGTPATAVAGDVADADHVTDAGGDLFVLDGSGRVIEIHVRDPAVLAGWPIDSVNALLGHLGQTGDVYADGDGQPVTFLYPRRGIHVRWDAWAGRITEVVLVHPAAGTP